MPTNRKRTGPAALLTTVVVGAAVAAGFVLTSGDGPATPSPSATAASGRGAVAGDGTVVFSRSGDDLPGTATLARCRSDDRAAVARYDTAALGDVVLQCGTTGQGYEHIRIRHTGDWSEVVRGHGDRDWDDVMLTAVQTALTTPRRGFPVDAGDGKVCYAAPVRFDDGSAPADPFVTVIVSATTDRVITAYPTSTDDC